MTVGAWIGKSSIISSSPSSREGTGIGLANVYGIVKQNEGFVNVYSEPGQGATFKIYLPWFEGENEGRTPESTLGVPMGCGETILLVRDEAAILNMGKATLQRLRYTVLSASTPGEAMSLAEAHAKEICLLVTDVVMWEMSDGELAKRIRPIKPKLQYLFSSRYTANVIAHRGVLDQAVLFIQKPFSMQGLAAKVREARRTATQRLKTNRSRHRLPKGHGRLPGALTESPQQTQHPRVSWLAPACCVRRSH